MKSFKSIFYFITISFISVFIVAGVYIGFRVYDANLNGLLPMDSEKLREDMYNVINNPIFTNTIISCSCIIYYFIRKKDVCPKNEISYTEKFFSFTTFKVVLFSIALSFVLRLMAGCLLFGLAKINLIDIQSILVENSSTQELGEKIANLLVITILVPIAEELLFRKILLSDLTKKYSHKKAIIIAYACFVLLHTGNNMFYSLFGGALLIYLYATYRNISICIMSHSAINFIGNVDLFLNDTWLYLITCFCVGIIGYYTYCEYKKQTKKIHPKH